MSTPLQHDYIGGLSEIPSMESPEKSSSSSSTLTHEGGNKENALNLKETELRLGLPGSESPKRKGGSGLSLSVGVLKSFPSGAKRGFSDAIDGSGNWVFSGNGGSDQVDLGKGAAAAVLFSPRGGLDNSSSQQGSAAGSVMKDVVPPSPKPVQEKKPQIANEHAPPAKAQLVGWPPIRSFRKNTMAPNSAKNTDDAEGKSGSGCLYVKVSMDGAPYLRKVDLKVYSNYKELSTALEKMFSCFTIGQCGSHGVPGRDGLSESRLMDLLHGSEYVLTYEDKDGDWMLVGDVPWEMFTDSCKRLRIMKGSEAIGLGNSTGHGEVQEQELAAAALASITEKESENWRRRSKTVFLLEWRNLSRKGLDSEDLFLKILCIL
ncbi:hypothetical protein Sjap_020015 [Stephania japonica]|uniref:Auxin-responsive protein n=1 Tax=Stephania japonica TaxID=461633 RepID=A0AAP0F1B2_9MAGN